MGFVVLENVSLFIEMFCYFYLYNDINFLGFYFSLFHTKTMHLYDMPWRFGIVVLASVSRPEDPGLESRKGLSDFKHCSVVDKTYVHNMHCHCFAFEKNNCFKIFYRICNVM
jgi:hypothetical protein